MKLSRQIKFLASIAVCQLAGAVGSVFTTPSIATWYADLRKPWFSPPNWVFAPVWITLFAMMGIALYLVWKKGYGKRTRHAIAAFGLQLALNVLWSLLFFGLRLPAAAFVEIVVLWAAIAYTTLKFKETDNRAAYLMLPYLAWVSFAAVLNYHVWVLN
ncbi:MAG: TspO/MBR family protein [Candidatus Aenigmatarchaeota archaeon]